MTRGDTVRLDFGSSLEILDLVQAVSVHMGRMAGLDDVALHWVSVAVRESVINAVKHGNCNDAHKRVRLEFSLLTGQPAGVRIAVRDEGCGFDPAVLPDPLAPENILKASGRGIFLIRNFMDELDIAQTPEGATEVVMVKRAGSGAAPRTGA
jgi:serine/threonine-protein kinase RsbW